MESRDHAAQGNSPGDIVYLLAEVSAGGRIHEIGSRAVILEAEGDELTLQLGDSERQLVSCPSAHVLCSLRRSVHAARSRRRPRPQRR